MIWMNDWLWFENPNKHASQLYDLFPHKFRGKKNPMKPPTVALNIWIPDDEEHVLAPKKIVPTSKQPNMVLIHNTIYMYTYAFVSLKGIWQTKTSAPILNKQFPTMGVWWEIIQQTTKPSTNKTPIQYSTSQSIIFLLVVSTPLKKIVTMGIFPQVGVNTNNNWNHQLD